MPETSKKPATVDEFIAAFPTEVRKGLQAIRKTIRQAAPEAEEVISYGIPAYRLNGMLIFFSAYTSHYSLAFPPVSAAFETFKRPLSKYRVSKSTIQFPFGEPLPLDLIRDIAALRAEENSAKAGRPKGKPAGRRPAKPAAGKTASKTTRKSGGKAAKQTAGKAGGKTTVKTAGGSASRASR